MHRPGIVHGVVRHYAWGSRDVIAALQQRPTPAARPEAELWFGAHESAPSTVEAESGVTPLDRYIAADPVAILGRACAQAFGNRLPFLCKVLAAEQPLSLQVHPDEQTARRRFNDEQHAGIPIDAPERTYRDRWPKPELIHALTPFEALSGFRDVNDTIRLLRGIDLALTDRFIGWLQAEGDAAYPRVVAEALAHSGLATATADGDWLVAFVGRVEDLARRSADDDARALQWIVELARRYPGDGGVIVAALLDNVRLAPGESLAMTAGNLHMYLRGVGVEVMASSDNVVRGGLTAKHVDIDELTRVIDPRARPIVPTPQRGGVPGEQIADVQVPHFQFSTIQLADAPVGIAVPSAQLLLTVDAELMVDAEPCRCGPGEPVTVAPSPATAVFIPACCGRVTVRGTGVAYRVTAGL